MTIRDDVPEIRRSPSRVRYTRFETCLGKLLLVGDHDGLRLALSGIYFDGERHALGAVPEGATEDDEPFLEVKRQLEDYLAGRRTSFDLMLAPVGTAFQRRVWRALSEIPYGTTRTYADIATSIGSPAAVRAVGSANGKNPLSIVVPCHRVVGKDGTLTGYAGGLPAKRRLLAIEASSRGGMG